MNNDDELRKFKKQLERTYSKLNAKDIEISKLKDKITELENLLQDVKHARTANLLGEIKELRAKVDKYENAALHIFGVFDDINPIWQRVSS